MHNLEIIRTFDIKATFTAHEWSLFTESMDCQYVADCLNEALTDSVNIHSDRSEVEREMGEKLKMYHTHGAFDTEPRIFLDDILDFIYGRKNG